MKKVLVMVMMLFTMSIGSYANESAINEELKIEKYEFKVNHYRLANLFGLRFNQMKLYDYVLSTLEEDMEYARSIDDDKSRDIIVSEAYKKNLKWMHYVLDVKQYEKYKMMLNLTFENKGFNVEELLK